MFTHFIYFVCFCAFKDFAVKYFPEFVKDLAKTFIVEVIIKRIWK